MFQGFGHDDGEALLDSFRRRGDAIRRRIVEAREAGVPIVYANDNEGVWDGDGPGLVRRALAGPGGDVIEPLRPAPRDRFVVKPRYSAFDKTPLELILRALEAERILLAGAALERCVVQTAIDARELGFKATVLAAACMTADARLEEISLQYLERVVGARIERGD